MAPVDGEGFADDGTAGLEGGRERRGDGGSGRRDGAAGDVAWPRDDALGVINSRRSLTLDDAEPPLIDASQPEALLLLFAAWLPPLFLLFLFLPCTFRVMSYRFWCDKSSSFTITVLNLLAAPSQATPSSKSAFLPLLFTPLLFSELLNCSFPLSV